jgi:hypothetical protein
LRPGYLSGFVPLDPIAATVPDSGRPPRSSGTPARAAGATSHDAPVGADARAGSVEPVESWSERFTLFGDATG